MKTTHKILIAFLLNASFSIFEFIGGMITGSVAIASDAVHDLGDAVSIGIAYFLEKISEKQPNDTHTFGYARYSVLGGFITAFVLSVGSILMLYHAVDRLIHPTAIQYSGMLVFAVIGVLVNLGAAFFTHDGESLNQKAVNLHMLEDVLGWIVVLVGAVVMHFTDFTWIDPLMSIGVSLFILIHAAQNLKEVIDLFLEKAPHGIDIEALKHHTVAIDGVIDVHHIHLWSMDGQHHCATMHIVTDDDPHSIKERVRDEWIEHGIAHVTIEIETSQTACRERHCHTDVHAHTHHHHHHHG